MSSRPVGPEIALCSTLAAWLRFASSGDIVAFGSVSRTSREVSRDAWLLVDDHEEAAKPSYAVACESPLVVVGLEFVPSKEARALIALGRVALSAAASMQARARARRLGCKFYVATDSEWLPAPCVRMLARVAARCDEVCGSSGGDGEGLELNYTPATTGNAPTTVEEAAVSLDAAVWWLAESGLHLDLNNGFPRRYATALCYLNDVEPSRVGATCFPLARIEEEHEDLQAAQRLRENGVHHTNSAVRQDEDELIFDSACDLLASASRLCLQDLSMLLKKQSWVRGVRGRGLRIQPLARSVAVFWSMTDDAVLDDRSWHGGARLLPAACNRGRWDSGKWTLQSFKQLPVDCANPKAFIKASRRNATERCRTPRPHQEEQET